MSILYEEIRNALIAPQVAIDNIKALCEKWDNGFGYKGKNYSANPQYQLQLQINSNDSEAFSLDLLNTSSEFVASVNKILAEHGLPYRILGKFKFNCVEASHDIFDITAENPDRKGWVDLVKVEFDYTIYHDAESNINYICVNEIEVKNTTTYAKNTPSNFHKADLVFVFYQDTLEIEILVANTTIKHARVESEYKALKPRIKIPAELQKFINFKRVNKDWTIADFNDK